MYVCKYVCMYVCKYPSDVGVCVCIGGGGVGVLVKVFKKNNNRKWFLSGIWSGMGMEVPTKKKKKTTKTTQGKKKTSLFSFYFTSI